MYCVVGIGGLLETRATKRRLEDCRSGGGMDLDESGNTMNWRLEYAGGSIACKLVQLNKDGCFVEGAGLDPRQSRVGQKLGPWINYQVRTYYLDTCTLQHSSWTEQGGASQSSRTITYGLILVRTFVSFNCCCGRHIMHSSLYLERIKLLPNLH